MKIGEGTIHANPGKVLDCACVVGVECDGETIALRFPAIERDDDNIGPMVYAHMRGTELRVTLCDRDNADIEFAWDETEGTWRKCSCAERQNGSVHLVAQPPRDVSDLYHELLYAVAQAFPGESRHETALRYIRERENRVGEAGSCKQNAQGQP